jgi:pyruvate/2-oxoglutarate dehydrogenase complex dihydrolipoamide acyltransferase (E2) component
MATDIILPKLGFSMTEGNIVDWLVADGGTVTAGEPLYTLEADKATQEIEAPASGTLRIAIPAGTEEIPAGTVIGSID